MECYTDGFIEKTLSQGIFTEGKGASKAVEAPRASSGGAMGLGEEAALLEPSESWSWGRETMS